MNEKTITQMLEHLRELPLSKKDAMELALLLIGWAQLSSQHGIPNQLRVHPRFLAEPSDVLRTWNAIGSIDPWVLRPFAEARILTLDAALLRPALEFAIRLTESGMLRQESELPPLLLADHLSERLEDGIPPGVATLLVELAGLQLGQTVYTPWDNYGQLAERAVGKGTQVFLECTESGFIPELVSLFADQAFEVRHADPIRSPAAVEQGKLRRFDVAIAFPPLGMRYEPEVSRRDLFDRFPEPTASGAVLCVRHLLAQVKSRIVVVVPNQLLFSKGVEAVLRDDLLDRRQIEAVIAMPPGLLRSSTVAFTILILRPDREQQSIRFIDANTRTYQEPISKARSRLTNLPDLIALLDPAKASVEAETVGAEYIQHVHTGHLQVQRFVLPAGSQPHDEPDWERWERVENLVGFVRPVPVASKGSTSTIEAWEIAATDLPDYGYILGPGRAVRIDARIAEKKTERFLRPLDIVLMVKGSVGRIGIVAPQSRSVEPQLWIAGQSAIVLRSRPRVQSREEPSGSLEDSYLDPRALFMALRSPFGQDLMGRIVVNASVPLILLADLEELAIPIPDEQTQTSLMGALEEEARLQSEIMRLQIAQSGVASSVWALQQQRQNRKGML